MNAGVHLFIFKSDQIALQFWSVQLVYIINHYFTIVSHLFMFNQWPVLCLALVKLQWSVLQSTLHCSQILLQVLQLQLHISKLGHLSRLVI